MEGLGERETIHTFSPKVMGPKSDVGLHHWLCILHCPASKLLSFMPGFYLYCVFHRESSIWVASKQCRVWILDPVHPAEGQFRGIEVVCMTGEVHFVMQMLGSNLQSGDH